MQTDHTQELNKIGKGFCGTVWCAPAETLTIKREDSGSEKSDYNDFIIHHNILPALPLSSRFCVTQCYKYVQNNDHTWWDKEIFKFPEQFQIRCNALVTERILPFPEAIRHKIISCDSLLGPQGI
ncbi:uncharacterized protein KY384_001374 [Bacidia gigantensis]|uniref:uncharacterized protein n=1 Tax=Bacidia gigantensis TaxID=2732470 RepID=UPI001D056672|nr:uncharacterized protein KY384_001374 [Bacidia gigantensis]KAG8533633.1 hypothetical protein KY384_001374 [Bacidia gigantensis]